MPSPNEISIAQLARSIGTPAAPTVIDVCIDADFEADPRLVPGALATGQRGARRRHQPSRPGAPQSAGLLAASVGLSRMYKDDMAQLEAGMTLYDAFCRWARDGYEEEHDWPGTGGRAKQAG